ncbi:hypothetical protein Vafri_5027 [Volvox africanus]|nr:hypothetical protein Vafri_5027 [Volvox africanus]
MGPHATEAEAVAAAAAEAAAEVYEDATAVEATVAASAAFATAAAEEARLSDQIQARPSSAPPASDSAAAVAPATLGRRGTGGVHGVGTSLDYDRGPGAYGDRAYGGRSPSRSLFRYIAPEELRLRRDLLAELQLRRRLSNALEDSRSAVLDLVMPVGADTDEMIQLVQAVRQQQRQQQQRSSAEHETGANRQESTHNDNGSGTDPPPQPAAPTAAVLAAMAPVQRHVSFAADTRGGESSVSSGGSNRDRGSLAAATYPPPQPRAQPGSESATAVALAAAAAAAVTVAPSGSTYTVQMGSLEGGEDTGGGGDDGRGAGEETAATAAEGQRRGRRHLTDAMIRVLNARAAGELMYPRPPAPDPFGELDKGHGEGEAPPATPSAVRAFAILAAMGGTKMDIRKLRKNPRLSAVEQMLAPPASSLLALLYLSSRRPVPHPDEFVAGTDLEYVAVGGDTDVTHGGGSSGGSVSQRPDPSAASPLSGWPPAGDLFMDFNSPRRAPYGQTYRHVEAWSVRDAALVLERQAREMELAGTYRMPRAYVEADKALKQRLNLDDPDLEDRADELRDQMRKQEYEKQLQEARVELREAERERYGYVRSLPMVKAAAMED